MTTSIQKVCLVLLLLLFPCGMSLAQNATPSDDVWPNNQMSPRSFLILASTHKYKTALRIAKKAKDQLKLPLDLRDLKPYKAQVIGDPILTLPQDVCDEESFGYPCYYPRGRYEELDYSISIEMTDAYEGLTEGYYIVIAAVTQIDDVKIKPLLQAAKTVFADAYIKTGKVYVGCMH